MKTVIIPCVSRISRFARATRPSSAGFSFQAAIYSIISTSAFTKFPQTKHSKSQCGPQLKRQSGISLLLTFRLSCIWSLTHFTYLEPDGQQPPATVRSLYSALSTKYLLWRETLHKWLQRTDTCRTFWPFSFDNHFLGLQGPPTNQGKAICRFLFLQVLPSLLIHNSFLYADICYAKTLPKDQLL